MIRTFETRLDLRGGSGLALSAVLDDYAGLMSRTERLLLAKLNAGRGWTGDLKVSFYQHLGISATHLDMAYRQLQAKLKSVAELAGDRARDLTGRIASKRTDIARKQKSLAKAKASVLKLREELGTLEIRVEKRRVFLSSSGPAMEEKHLFALKHLLGEFYKKQAAYASSFHQLKTLRAVLHQHKRRLAILELRRDGAQLQAKKPSNCFGSRKLFRAQFALEENGYRSLDAWRNDWRSARSAQFTIDGNSSKESGNQFTRLRRRDDGCFDLELRLPRALAHLATRSFSFAGQPIDCVDFAGLSFNHGNKVITSALDAKVPLTLKFVRDDMSWKVFVTVDDGIERVAADFGCGAIGVDLNAGHVSAALLDAVGNPIEVYNFPCVTYGKTSVQARDAVRKVAAEIAALAARHNVPVVSEKLDFARKKQALASSEDARYARMLSAFTYSAFDAALASACLRGRVEHVRVNPAYTSIIGRVKFVRRYGLSVHEAASVTIARRAMGYSERLPRFSTGTVTVPTNGSDHVTLDLPVRKEASEETLKSRHVWSEWNGLNKEYHKKALAARRSSGRRPDPDGDPRRHPGGAEHRSMVLRRRRDVPAGCRFSHATQGWSRAGKKFLN